MPWALSPPVGELLAEYEKTQKQKSCPKQAGSTQQRYHRLLANQKWELILKRSGWPHVNSNFKGPLRDETYNRFERLKQEALPLLQQYIGRTRQPSIMN